jgi:hypothetical protein
MRGQAACRGCPSGGPGGTGRQQEAAQALH